MLKDWSVVSIIDRACCSATHASRSIATNALSAGCIAECCFLNAYVIIHKRRRISSLGREGDGRRDWEAEFETNMMHPVRSGAVTGFQRIFASSPSFFTQHPSFFKKCWGLQNGHPSKISRIWRIEGFVEGPPECRKNFKVLKSECSYEYVFKQLKMKI